MSKRKGITPVIAVILLLGITVAAVGLLYPQIQNMISNTNTDVNTMGIDITSKYDNGGNLTLIVRNTGSETWNTSAFTLQFVPGGTGGPVGLTPATSGTGFTDTGTGNDCFFGNFSTTGTSSLVAPGDQYECGTGLSFPEPTKTIDVVIVNRESGNVMAKESCSPQTSNAVGC
ncbi:MAG: archaellin/type IV pilin N-terminal domain-containing protein [Candidatus Nanohaloarchaea archaeon]